MRLLPHTYGIYTLVNLASQEYHNTTPPPPPSPSFGRPLLLLLIYMSAQDFFPLCPEPSCTLQLETILHWGTVIVTS